MRTSARMRMRDSRPGGTDPVAAAYQVCADITRREARNFSYGIALLPLVERQAMTAVYAMARRIDDIGDGDLPNEVRLDLLERTREELTGVGGTDGGRTGEDQSGEDQSGEDPDRDFALLALDDAARRLPIPMAAFGELIDGCTADVLGRRYERFADLQWYCRCVAGSVGRLSLGVYDAPQNSHANELADALGVALQLTNILRDVREDRINDRVYLPAEDMGRFGCALELDDEHNLTDSPARFAALVRFEVERARQWYDRGLELLPMLDHRSAACTAAMAGIYRRLLDRIDADPEAVRRSRMSLPTRAKAAVALRAVILARA